MINKEPLLEVKELRKYYPVFSGLIPRHVGDIKAVDGVSFTLNHGEILGLVGESGCGKSTLGRSVIRLEEPTSGEVYYKGSDIMRLSRYDMRKLRREIQVIFQDPEASLDPRMTIGDIIMEPLDVHRLYSKGDRYDIVRTLMREVGIDPELFNVYPHELSGGQRQRVGIARALAIRPEIIIADEPVSALDVSVQAQILNLLMDIHIDKNISFIFISHDLSVVRYVSDKIVVMYLGKFVEMADKKELYENCKHPYTEVLLSIIPDTKYRKREKVFIKGEIPSPANPPSGCRFHTRCQKVMQICDKVEPEFKEIKPNHYVACHLYS